MMISRSLLALACLCAASAVVADDRLFLAGAEVSDGAYYGYTGLILPGPHRENGRGFVQRYWLDSFGYEYDGATDRIKATAYGAEAALGYGTSSERGWGTVSLGLRFTNTDLSPDDPAAKARGSQLGVKFQLEGERQIADAWRLGGAASYTSEQDSYWARVRLMHGTPARALGAEFVANGNNEAHSEAAGFVVSFQPRAGAWSVGLKAGYRKQSGADGPYGGVELGYAF